MNKTKELKKEAVVEEFAKAHYKQILWKTDLLLEYAKLRNESNLKRLISELIDKSKEVERK